MPRKVEATLGAERRGDRWNCAIAADKPRRCNGYVLEAALQHSLEVRTATDISVTNDQNSSRTRFRQSPTRREMPAGVHEAIVQVADRMVDTLQCTTRRECAVIHGAYGISSHIGHAEDVHDA